MTLSTRPLVNKRMKVTKTSEKDNPFLERKEVTFFIDHYSMGTPQLLEVRKSIASMYEVDSDLVYVTKLETLTGTNRAVGEAEVYEKPEKARLLVPKHIQSRNLPERRKKGEQGKAEK